MLGPLSLIHLIPGSLIVVFILAFILVPYRKIASYKSKGATTYFFPVLGILNYWANALKSKGDVWANTKEANKKSSNDKYFVSNISRSSFIMLQDPQYIKDFLLKQNLYYVKSRVIEPLKFLIGNGLVTAEGETWKRHRKIISNSFNFEFLKTNMKLIQDTVRQFLMETSVEEGNQYPAISKIQEITGEIVGKIFFSENLNAYTFEGKPLTLALADIVSELALVERTPLIALLGAKFLKYSLIPRHRRIMGRVMNFRKLCFDIIRDRKAQPQKSTDLLASLLATQSSDDPEKRFSDADIVDEFITFFIAGMDTTGHLIGMTLYNLTQYPQYIQALKEERDSTYNQEKDITTDTLHRMDCLHALLKETLRFYTPAPLVFGRLATTDHKLLDLDIQKGDIVTTNLLYPAFDPKHFDNPQEFNPERWRQPESKTDPYAFTPFSAGPRNCIGQHLAIVEAKIIISEFLEKFDFKLKDGYDLKMSFRFLYEPENDVLLHLSPKTSLKVI